MSLVLSSARTALLVAAGEENHPLFFYDNALTGGTRTLSTTGGALVGDGTEEDATTGTTYDTWSAIPATSGTAVSFRVTFPINRNLGFLGVAVHNLGTLGATVTFQSSTDSGSAWTTIGTATPTDDRPLGIWGVGALAADYRMRVSDITDADTVTCAVVSMAQSLQMPHRKWSGYQPVLAPTEVQSQSNVSTGGQFLGSSVVRRGSMTSVSFDKLSPNFVRGDDWNSFQQHFNDTKPFFWAWRPTAYPDLDYAWRSGGSITPVNTGINHFLSAQVSMQVHEQ